MRRPWRHAVALGAALAAIGAVRAETDTDGGGSASAALSAVARLDFVLNIGKFIFFRVGTGAYPTASTTVETVAFTLVPSIPAAPTVPPATANNVVVPWNAAAPTFTGTSSTNVLPVEVRSNAGQVTVRAAVTTALVSGLNSIPFSQITITSSSADLPAPLIPDAGAGATVNIAGSSFGNRVTQQSGTWTFGYNPVAVPPAGAYSGQVTFTAASP
ncbi:hypothetical protein FN976_26700 [Caenimonas sedimenti]|uniref:IPT/TIG domain-containing protein n=1 Tax=Caenimonas sedimenti TaxID=2596921 RepID=A0A562ZFM7_9BURK|nr:hypothetical protein [Caenimonas sedimenti]TWO66139.1 hypothetical protein FN976_26700 [Caenimonas sedimenti]